MAKSEMILAVAVLAILVFGATAASPAPSNCDSATTSLVPCYGYITGSDTKPPSACCTGLRDLNTNSPGCLCTLITQLNQTASSDPSVNVTKAYNLPSDCAVALDTSSCPALAGFSPSSGATPGATPGSSSPAAKGPTASVSGPGTAAGSSSDGARFVPTNWVMVMAFAGVGAKALLDIF